MLRRGEDLLLRRHLDDLAEIHHGNAVRHVLDDRQIVADEQQREAELALQVLQQIDDLRLDGDVERRDRLVADDQFGFGGERPGDADALALAAGEFVRPAAQRVARQAHGVHQRRHLRVEFGGRFGEAEIADRLGQDVAHAHARIEAGERILEHHLHAAAHAAQPAGRKIVDALAIQHHLAGGDVEQPQDGPADRRLAAAGFADQRQRLAARRPQRTRRPPHRPSCDLRLNRPPRTGKCFLRSLTCEQWRVHAATACLSA